MDQVFELDLVQALDPLASLVGPARAQWMTQGVPAAILDGGMLPAEPPVEPRRRSLFRRRGL